ncbi:beta-1,6-N-acetylglucosaminyltransferase [Actibacterium ureilyticum]|uniref:DUF5927 domain-containing protein n=1 Tax=Actibacterium ureilyticum TaxID=1590614 RepID=UPI000BAAA24D|nr:beta-1,6-N-acetylglucosaminyltransferase [Actibacterium ureilyticum]
MTVGFVMLVHTALDRAAQVARFWAESGCPVVLHADARVPHKAYGRLVDDLRGLENVRFVNRHRVVWGTWSMVRATQVACEEMLAAFPQVGHVYLASGSCLPLRPVQELQAYLHSHPETDFIESVTTAETRWTIDGLEEERFHLRFPFSWKTNRRLFDGYVRLQRRLKVKRRIPGGIVPHLGSQWWCMSRRTLTAILHDPKRAEYDRYFRRVWIPDESYFQSLVRLHSTAIESRSLTLSKFDFQGKPHVFYDDHLQLLRRSDCFVARKIWPQAERLYQGFLSNDPAVTKNAEPKPAKIDRVFAQAVEKRVHGRAGLYMAGRYPIHTEDKMLTSGPYTVFEGFSDLFQNFAMWLEKAAVGRVHGHLFHPEQVQFAGRAEVYNGGLGTSALLRDHSPESFLTSLIWNTRDEHQCFQFGPRDRQRIGGMLARDPNARIRVISGAWALELFRTGAISDDLLALAAALQEIEARHIRLLQASHARADVVVWTLADFLLNPLEPLQEIVDELTPHRTRNLSELPQMVDLTGFGQFLQALKNQGVHLHLAGDVPLDLETPTAPQDLPRFTAVSGGR